MLQAALYRCDRLALAREHIAEFVGLFQDVVQGILRVGSPGATSLVAVLHSMLPAIAVRAPYYGVDDFSFSCVAG